MFRVSSEDADLGWARRFDGDRVPKRGDATAGKGYIETSGLTTDRRAGVFPSSRRSSCVTWSFRPTA